MTEPRYKGGAACPNCQYSLRGMPLAGLCPECGAPYTPDTALRRATPPPAKTLCLQLGWPLIGFIASGLGAYIVRRSLWGSPGGEAVFRVLTLLAALMLGSMLLYVPLRAGRLIRSCATLAERHKPSMKHIATLGFWPAAIVVVSTAIPILCLMVARQVYVDW